MPWHHQIKPPAFSFVQVDIKGGKLTYGQRIELGTILADQAKIPAERHEAAIRCLYPQAVNIYTPKWIERYDQIVEGVRFWIDRESAMLQYKPSADELAAGIEELGHKLGPMSTVMTLAEKFARDPDEILKWEYGKVFGLLYADLENFKYQQRYRRAVEARERSKQSRR